MKTLLTLLLVLFVLNGSAQTGKLMNRYYVTGSLTVGKESRAFADSSAWLEIGTDTTSKGIIFPRVLLDSIKTTKRAFFVYDIKDSVLYHLDGNQKVRYMTYKDTTFLKSNFLQQGGNDLAEVIKIGSKDNQSVDIISNSKAAVRVFASGNISIGDTQSNNYQLSINGDNSEGVLHLHKGGQSTFLKTTTNNDNAYTHTLAIGRHRIKTQNYGISFSADDNEDFPVFNDVFRIKNVYNSNTFTPFKVLGANSEPYFTVTGLGSVLVGVDVASSSSGYKVDVNGALRVETIYGRYKPSKPYLEIMGNESLLLHAANGNNGSIILGLSGVSSDFSAQYSNSSRSYIVANRDVSPVSGSGNLNYNNIELKDNVNYSSVTGENIYRGIFYNPTVIGNVEQHAVELNNTHGWGLYQTSNNVGNYFNGNVSIGTTLTDNAKLRIEGGDVAIKGGVNSKLRFETTTNNQAAHEIGFSFRTGANSMYKIAARRSTINSRGNIEIWANSNEGADASSSDVVWWFGQGTYAQSSSNANGSKLPILVDKILIDGSVTNGKHIGPVADMPSENAAGFDVHAGDAIYLHRGGGTLSLRGGKNAGSGLGGDVLIQASKTGVASMVQNDLVDIARFTGHTEGVTINTVGKTNALRLSGNDGYLGIHTTTPKSLLDINGLTGYSQLRLRTSYTPTSSSDTNGEVGDVSWDDGYMYIRTSTGWKRSALTTF